MLLPANFRTVDPLSNFSVRYINDPNDYAALKILPYFGVGKNVFKFYIYDKQNLRSEILDAPSGTEAPRFDYQVSSASATALEYAAKHLVLGKDARDFDRPVADLRQDAALANTDKMLIHLESATKTLLCTAANYNSNVTSALSNAWSGNAGDPIEDVRLARQAVKVQCGMRPNTMALSQKTLDYLKNHAAIVERLKYVGIGAASNAEAVVNAIASLFELKEIIVSDAVSLTSAEGATDVTANIWTSDVVIFVKNESQALRQQSFGRTFMVNQLSTKTINKPELARGDLGAEEIETSWEWVQKFTMQDSSGKAEAGYLYTGAY